jgi:thiol-disulfide isomerase/thioredoxin
MGKAARNRQQSVRERIAAQQAAARRAEARRRLLITGGAIVVVLAIVLAFVLIKLNSGSSGSSGTSGSSSSVTGTALPASVNRHVTGVPVSTLNTIGEGSVLSYNPSPISAIAGAALTSNGKPEMLYIGAEYCPYCAALRWSMAVALSRFGTLSPLRGIHSSPTDAFPNTATLTFYKSSYASKYLVFTPVENETVTRAPLQQTTAEQQKIWETYEPDVSTRGYPFIDFGNKYLIKAPIYDPSVLAGQTWSQIASALHDPSSPIAQGVNGAANLITAAICKTTGNQPAKVCTSPMITSLQAKL